MTQIDRAEERQKEVLKVLETFRDSLRKATFSVFGDPFASPVFLPVLQQLDSKEYPNLKYTFFTNGLLLPKYWDSLAKIHGNVEHFSVSMDAATKETYGKMRLGGKWEDLEEAIALIESLDVTWVWNFVVCKTNFEEIPLFVERAQSHGAKAKITPLRRWRHMSEELYLQENVCNSDHPDHGRLLEILDGIEGEDCYKRQMQENVWSDL
jgi:MoaA/NifB/PqqE/SkfB family radical SAM enzyme